MSAPFKYSGRMRTYVLLQASYIATYVKRVRVSRSHTLSVNGRRTQNLGYPIRLLEGQAYMTSCYGNSSTPDYIATFSCSRPFFPPTQKRPGNEAMSALEKQHVRLSHSVAVFCLLCVCSTAIKCKPSALTY